MAPSHLQDIAEFTRVLQLNVLGTLIPLKHTVPHLVKSGRGSFVGMSSIAGDLTHLWFGAYPVAKAGLEALVRTAADEYGPTGVRVNAIRPGFISTEIMEGIAARRARLPELPREHADGRESRGGRGRARRRRRARALPRSVRTRAGSPVRSSASTAVTICAVAPNFTSFIEPALGWDVMLARKEPGS